MKKLLLLTSLTLLAGVAYAEKPAMDAHTADSMTTQTKSVRYTCQGKRQLTITYGFDKDEAATFAEAKLNGKKRFMPINRNLSDEVSTVFGDENNFSLNAERLDLSTFRKVRLTGITAPDGAFTHKDCAPMKARKKKK